MSRRVPSALRRELQKRAQHRCEYCNRLKSSDISSIDLETGRIVRLFNPRRDDWKRHFRLRLGKVVPRTAIGRATEYFLQLNRKDAINSRLHPTVRPNQ